MRDEYAYEKITDVNSLGHPVGNIDFNTPKKSSVNLFNFMYV